MRVSRAMEWGVPDIAATEEFLPDEVRVMPSLPGPASVAVGPCMLLLGREDYDAETLEAIFRHELAHTHGVKATGLRSMCAIMSAIFWFLPPVWMLKREMRVREEFICDRDANLGCTLEKRRAYARAMASLAADRKRELPGTAGMACGAATLRRRVEALFRPEKPQGGWRDMLYNVVLCPLLALAMAIGVFALFGGPAQFTLTEETLLQYIGDYSPEQGMAPAAMAYILLPESAGLYSMQTGDHPYGAAAVYWMLGDIYLAYPDAPAAADEACAQLTARLTALLGETVEEGCPSGMLEDAGLRYILALSSGADPVRYQVSTALRYILALSPGAGPLCQQASTALRWQGLAVWRGTTDDGTAAITLARADSTGGTVAALLCRRQAV